MFWNKVYEGGLTWHTELSLFGAHTLLWDPHRLITFGGGELAPGDGDQPLHHPRGDRAADGGLLGRG